MRKARIRMSRAQEANQSFHPVTVVAFDADRAEGTAEGAGQAPDREPDRTVSVSDADGQQLLLLRMWEPGEGGGSTLEAVATGPAALQPGTRFTLPSWRADRVSPEREDVVAR